MPLQVSAFPFGPLDAFVHRSNQAQLMRPGCCRHTCSACSPARDQCSERAIGLLGSGSRQRPSWSPSRSLFFGMTNLDHVVCMLLLLERWHSLPSKGADCKLTNAVYIPCLLQEDSDVWVTVFGFQPSQLPLIMQDFAKCGDIVQFGNGREENNNWVHIKYAVGAAPKGDCLLLRPNCMHTTLLL